MDPRDPALHGQALVFFTVGTDHHPFDRVVEWADRLAADSAGDLEVVVQFGTSRPPTEAKGHEYLPGAELDALIERATVVVSHGGPATIMQIRDSGQIPLVVPRDPARGEHVDGHQQRFVARLAVEGTVAHVESYEQLVDAVSGARDGTHPLSVPPGDARVASVVRLAGDLIDALVAGRRAKR